jgi:hypothetical protein
MVFSAAFPGRAAVDKEFPRLVKSKVEEINQALIKGEYDKVVDLTLPKLVEKLGGRDKMTIWRPSIGGSFLR